MDMCNLCQKEPATKIAQYYHRNPKRSPRVFMKMSIESIAKSPEVKKGDRIKVCDSCIAHFRIGEPAENSRAALEEIK